MSEELEDAVLCLTHDGSKSQTKEMVEKAIKVVWYVAVEKGLESNTILTLVRCVIGKLKKRKLSNHLCTRIVRYLIPRTTVPVSTLFQCLGSMRTLNSSLQLQLFRWMVVVYDFVDNLDDFLATYDIIFQYLQYDNLRPAVSQLLCYMTTREHVREFRVQRLMELHQRVVVSEGSSKSSLMALIALYKLNCPHLVPVAQPPPRKVWFRRCEKSLAGDIARVQKKRVAGSQLSGTASTSSMDLFHRRILAAADPPLSKRRKKDHTASSVPLSPSHDDGGRVSITSVTSVADLCQNVHHLKLPCQMAGVLDCPFLPHVLSLGPECSAALHLTHWLQAILSTELDVYVPGAAENKPLSHLLTCLIKVTGCLLELIPSVGVSLSKLLLSWNGVDYAPSVFKLLSYLPLQSFTDLESKYLEPLKQLMVKKNESKEGLQLKCLLFSCLTDLLRFWALLELPRYQKRKEELSSSPMEGRNSRLSAFADSVWSKDNSLDDFDPYDSIVLLVRYTERLLCIGMETEKGHALMQHAAATFYEVVTRLPEDYGMAVFMVPCPQLVNQALLSQDLSALSRLLQCYVSCKTSLSNLEKAHRDLPTIQQFNSVVLDLCDSLWRDLAFANYPNRRCQTHLFTTDKSYLEACGFTHPVASKLSVIHHPALLGFVKTFFRDEGVDPSRSRRKSSELTAIFTNSEGLKEQYLDYLHRQQLTGLVNFIRTFIPFRSNKRCLVQPTS